MPINKAFLKKRYPHIANQLSNSGRREPKGVRKSFFLNMELRDEGILPTKSGQAFEAMTILSKAKAFAVIAQK